MKALIGLLLLVSTASYANNWEMPNVNAQSRCLFSSMLYVMPGDTCNGTIPDFYGVGTKIDPVTYDSGLGNYYPDNYPYPYSTENAK